MSFRVLVLGTAITALGGVSAAFAQAATTRIEPRPVYGATVTIEEGVRVFRPLPPERNVIINPGGTTPLTLGLSETRVLEHTTVESRNIHEHRYYGGPYGYRRCLPAVGTSC